MSFFLGPKPAKVSLARLSARAGRTQAATWAWAGKVPRRTHPPGPNCGPATYSRSIRIDGSSTHLGRSKPAAVSAPKTLESFRFLRFSLYALSSQRCEHRAVTERPKMVEGQSHGTVAGPLTGVRAPQRVSVPPSSGLTMAPPWPNPTSSAPGSAFFSPHAGEPHYGGVSSGQGRPPLPLLIWALFVLLGFNRFGDLGLGFLFPIRFVRFGSSLSFDFFFSVLLGFHPIGD